MDVIANILAAIGNGVASTSSSACPVLFIDEPEAPKALIEK